MDIKEIRQLVKLMVDQELTEVDISDGEQRVHLKRGSLGQPVVSMTAPAVAPAPALAPASGEPEPQTNPESPSLPEIKSPMVGTFYATPSPDSPAYVQVGDSVNADTVVCIVEAMKVMNEIKAECAGTIAEICVESAQPVEFGQVLFRVKPA